MQNAPTVLETPTQNQLSSESPAVQELVKHLPPHFVEHVGEKALQLSHIDMHPVVVRGSGENTYTAPDHSRRILDSDTPEEEFEQSSIDAAKAGREKLAKVLHESTTTLAEAHALLVENGYDFDPPEGETPEDQIKRHDQEKNDIATCAYQIVAERAIELKRSGNQQAAIEALEVLNAIVYLGPNEYGNKASEKISRRLVHEGLANEVVISLQESGKIGPDAISRIGGHATLQKEMLQFATGKELDYDFSVVGNLDTEKIQRLNSSTAPLEILAIVTSPHSEMSEDSRRQLLEKMKGWRVYPKIKEKLDTQPSYVDASAYYELAETCESEGSMDLMEYAFRFDDPLALKGYADKLGLPMLDVGMLLGKSIPAEYDRQTFDKQAAEELAVLAEKHPLVLGKIMQNFGHGRGYRHESYSSLLKALDSVEDEGIRDDSVVNYLVSVRSVEDLKSATSAIKYSFEYAEKNGYGHEEFIEKMRHGERGDGFYYELILLLKDSELQASESSESSEVSTKLKLDGAIENIMIDSGLRQAYLSLYKQVGYPATPNKLKELRLGLESFPEIAHQLKSLGVNTSLAEDIFTTWATYNSLQVHSYSDENGFQSIDTEPDGSVMEQIIRNQSRAITFQLNAIKKYHAEFGDQELKQVIDVFGIYNFSRHELPVLHDQLARWSSGQAVETVVAEARADWNSFSGKMIDFEDESLKPGVFYFEVNSATELSKLAVSLGQRERQLGREPDISRFIVHAHGNPTGMLLGVNNEKLNLDLYAEAAKSRAKISGAERNDYVRHLGPNFTVILQSCSAAGGTNGINIASKMSEELGTRVTGADDSMTTMTIASDGSVIYKSGREHIDAVTY